METFRLGAGLCLHIQQFDFAGDIPPVAAESAVGADHAVAGHDAHHRVGTDRLSHRSGRLGSVNPFRDVPVGGHHAVGYREQIPPHLKLKRRAIKVQTQTRHFVIMATEQQKGLFVHRHGAVAESRLRKMPLQCCFGFPLHGGGHDETDSLGGRGNQHAPDGSGLDTVADGEGLFFAHEFFPRHRLYPDAAMFFVVHFE